MLEVKEEKTSICFYLIFFIFVKLDTRFALEPIWCSCSSHIINAAVINILCIKKYFYLSWEDICDAFFFVFFIYVFCAIFKGHWNHRRTSLILDNIRYVRNDSTYEWKKKQNLRPNLSFHWIRVWWRGQGRGGSCKSSFDDFELDCPEFYVHATDYCIEYNNSWDYSTIFSWRCIDVKSGMREDSLNRRPSSSRIIEILHREYINSCNLAQKKL